MNFYIPSEDVPSSFPYVFTTTGLSKAVPDFDTFYGSDLPVDLQCQGYKTPSISLENIVSVNAPLSCNFIVRVSPHATSNAFTLTMNFYTEVAADMKEDNGVLYVYLEFDQSNTEFSNYGIINSNVGIFDTNKISLAINYYIYAIILEMNERLENDGFRLPLPEGIKVQSYGFNLYSGGLEIGIEPVIS